MRFFIVPGLALMAGMASAQPAPLATTGTPLKLMVWNEVSTRTAKPGDRFLLRLETAVVAGEAVVIPRGAQAWGEVVSASGSGMGGKAGKLETRLLHIEVDGRPIRIAPAKPDALADKGRDGSLQIVLATAALTPWGPFARGNNARLKAGALVDAVLAEDLMPAAATP
ncbi:hypothetical protein [Sandarakinorhabdus cyanobacteriorum]|nr:hypothetical protein [Sandarakinorhabdus cyanobacteriorum]